LRNFYIYEPLKIFYCIYISLAALWFALLEISVSVYVLLSVCEYPWRFVCVCTSSATLLLDGRVWGLLMTTMMMMMMMMTTLIYLTPVYGMHSPLSPSTP